MRADLLERILRLGRSQIEGDGQILDIGCGPGWWLRTLADRGVSPSRLHGVDIRADELRDRSNLPEGIELRDADVRALPYPDGRFELVLLLTVLSSLPTAEAVRAALAEAHRVLAAGGLLVCYEPRVPNPLNRFTRHVRMRDYRAALGPELVEERLTVLPPLARRLGSLTPRVYPRARRIRPLTTHRLVAYRRPRS